MDPINLAVVAGRPLNPWDVVIYRELARQGIQATILGSVNEDGSVPSVHMVTVRDIVSGNRGGPFAQLGAMVHSFTQSHGIGYLPSPVGFDDATFGLRAVLHRFDAVLAIETHRASTYQACRSGVPTLVRVSENIPNNPPQFPARWFRSEVRRRAAGFVCQTESAARALREEGVDPTMLSVVPETVDTELFRPLSGARPNGVRPIVGFAGELSHRHGVLDVLDAFALVARRTDAALRIAGEGELRQAVLSRIRQQGLERRVELLGKLRYREMPDFFRGIDVLCMPYRETAEWKPQFGVATIESMSSGTPVVTTAAGAIPEILAPALRPYSVVPGDTRGLGASLEAFLADPVLRGRLGREARDWVCRRYDGKVLGAHWTRLLRGLPGAAS